MKISPKSLARATYLVAKEKGSQTAASGLLNKLKRTNQLKLIPQVLVELSQVEAEYGILEVKVYSATKLSNDQLDSIKNKIKKETDSDQIILKTLIDPDLLGGIKIVYGDKTIDQTIKSRINKLKSQLVNQ